MDCAIIVVTHNSGAHIERLLDSLPAAAGGCSYRVIVVDNDSADDTVDRVRKRGDATCILAEANLGYGGGINLGRRHAGPRRSYLVLNSDVQVTPGAIERLFSALFTSGTGIVVPRLVDDTGNTHLSLMREPTLLRALGDALAGDHVKRRPAGMAMRVHHRPRYEQQGPIDWATGAAFLVRSDCDEAIGDWDAQFFMYSEEVDICRRARAAGFTIEYVPTAAVIHFERGSGRGPDLDALMVLNQLRYFRKYHGRVASAALRIILSLHEATRFHDAARRYSARVVLGLAPPPQFDGAPPIEPVRW